jgi:hypothetical protein
MKTDKIIIMVSMCLALLGMLLFSGQVLAQEGDIDCQCPPIGDSGVVGNHEVVVSLDQNIVRFMTTFENGDHLAPISDPIAGMHFAGWYTLTSGTYSNNPSTPTVAFWLGGSSAAVTFDEPVASVSLSYASMVPVTLEAFDATGTLLATATAPANAPGGLHTWDPLGIDVGENVISSIRLTGGSLRTMIDNFEVAYVSEREVYSIAVFPTAIVLSSDVQVSAAILSTEYMDATMVDLSTVLIGDPRASTAVQPVCSQERDVDGDGMIDLYMGFCLYDLIEAGALDGHTIQLLLTGMVETAAHSGNPDGMTPTGLQTAGERLERNRQKLIEKGNDAQASETLSDVTEELDPSDESIIGVVSVSVQSSP